ncbi:thioredoxin domain-containing protein [Lactiplantibacillus sp. WILCCON 0030]|uniref:Thioredoxin domain-containing protein n=1 Tax=Lactiplantibacillus brownii TaxID=3069269 RepID=A0ABU1ABN4_9LACO|nr:thioredoxin domain-containing protein [Lactiplantibacillus brownii]MDQ7938376.1 thioredoxin domain-containing protein [Lactiplantibacillus brownii]
MMSLDETNFEDFGRAKPMLTILTTRFCTAGERCDWQFEHFLTLATKWQGYFDFSQIDVDNAPFVAVTWAITKMPTVVLVVEGQVVARYATVPSDDVIKKWLKNKHF